jgi:hypothetical protein
MRRKADVFLRTITHRVVTPIAAALEDFWTHCNDRSRGHAGKSARDRQVVGRWRIGRTAAPVRSAFRQPRSTKHCRQMCRKSSVSGRALLRSVRTRLHAARATELRRWSPRAARMDCDGRPRPQA